MKNLVLSTLALVLTANSLFSYYDPEQGRWLSRDPIGEEGGVNVYGFAMNNAVGHIDPLGRRIYITSGNKNAKWWNFGNRWFHQDICVDKYMGKQVVGRICFSYSFSPTEISVGNIPSHLSPFVGRVYETDDVGLKDSRTLCTCPLMDMDFLRRLRELELTEDGMGAYGLFNASCRTFAQGAFEWAQEHYRVREGAPRSSPCLDLRSLAR